MMLARLMTGVALTLFAGPVAAQVNCGDQPRDVPLEVQEELKGDVEGKAQLFTRLLGHAQLRGAVNASRHELNERHQNVDKSQLDRYMLWTTCQAIMADRTLTPQNKLAQYLGVYKAIQAGDTRRELTRADAEALLQENRGNIERCIRSQKPISLVMFFHFKEEAPINIDIYFVDSQGEFNHYMTHIDPGHMLLQEARKLSVISPDENGCVIKAILPAVHQFASVNGGELLHTYVTDAGVKAKVEENAP